MPVPENMETKDIAPESNHIKAAEFPKGWRASLEVSDVNVELFERDGKKKNKFILSFKGKAKTFVLNATNTAFLEAALGAKPSRWMGATITLSVAMVKYQNGLVPGFLIVGAKPAPDQAGQMEPGSDEAPF
jgi:hypothetical protein